MNNSLSVCMIVKNEEKNLERCLESIKDIADEIVVVDTGSIDNTIEVAKEYTDKVISHKWNNDFSEARNISLENATKKWILILDADEALPQGEGIKLKTILKQNPQFEAFHLRLVNYISNIDIGDAIVLRVFKNNPKYRFRGRMHEQVIHSINENGGLNKVGSTDVKIAHYGYDPKEADVDAKQKRNLELLLSYPDSDRDGYYYFSLGNEYTRNNEYDKALETYRKSEEFQEKSGEVAVHLSYLAENVVKTLFAKESFMEAIDKVHQYQIKFKNFRDLYFLEALAYMECSRFTAAKAALTNYINCTKFNYEYPCGNFEKQYNIQDLMNKLQSNSVDHENNLLSVILIVDRYEFSVLEAVKSVNEIADEVIVVGTVRANLERQKLENIGVKVMEIKATGREQLFIEAYKNCGCKYVLLMKPKEIITIKNQRKLVEELTGCNEEFLYLKIANNYSTITTEEFRVMKNKEELKTLNSLKEYMEYIKAKDIKETKIEINNVYM